MMAFEILYAKLMFTVDRLVQILDNHCSGGLRDVESSLNIIDEDCQTLRLMADLRGTCPAWAHSDSPRPRHRGEPVAQVAAGF